MGKPALNLTSPYAGSCFILTTKHAKSVAFAPALWNILEVGVLEYVVDTDRLGTFTGEIEREGTALESARRKCEWPLKNLGDSVEFALAIEGSFGPHPSIPDTACDHEVLYFIDRRHGFRLQMSHTGERTNYRSGAVDSPEALNRLAAQMGFPSHALILRPEGRHRQCPVFKGIQSQEALESAFRECLAQSSNNTVWVETDMRAQFNPTRMKVIAELAEKFAERLASRCPHCDTPGWGRIDTGAGPEYGARGAETGRAKTETHGCAKCGHTQAAPRKEDTPTALSCAILQS
jgi:hypothetical protein